MKKIIYYKTTDQIINMSFLKTEHSENEAQSQANNRSNSVVPTGYDRTKCYVHIRPTVKPISTHDYVHNEYVDQKDVIQGLTDEGQDLFQQKPVIKKQFGQEQVGRKVIYLNSFLNHKNNTIRKNDYGFCSNKSCVDDALV